MSSFEDDFIAIDYDGNTIDPNAEASVAAAEEFGDELFVHDGTDEWYLEGMRECEELRARLDAFVLPHLTNSSDTDSTDADDDNNNDDGADCVLGNMEDDVMGEASFSREYSDAGADEWVLETLLKRRTTHSIVRDVNDDGAQEAHVDYEYLCKWKWYREPTWESRSALEDLGLVARLDAFDAARSAKPRTAKRRPQRPKRVKQRKHTKAHRHGTLETLMGDTFPDAVLAKLRESATFATQYASVLNDAVEHRFIRRWKESPSTFTPMILFHGTRRQNITSIATGGLKVPGTSPNVRVVNGCLHGVGIYAAKDASYSQSFTDCDKMFVCLGLVGPQYTTMKECGSVCVFFDDELIVPLWLIHFQRTAPIDPPIRTTFGEVLRAASGIAATSVMDPPAVIQSASTPQPPPSMTKKMLKQMPRAIKELYKTGRLHARKSS